MEKYLPAKKKDVFGRSHQITTLSDDKKCKF